MDHMAPDQERAGGGDSRSESAVAGIEGDKPDARSRPGLGLLDWLACFVGSFLVTVLAASLTHGDGATQEVSPRQLLAGAAALPLCFVAATAWAVTRRSRRPAGDVLHLPPPSRPDRARRLGADAAIGVAAGVGLQILVVAVYALLRVSVDQTVSDSIQEITGVQRSVLVVVAALVAPVGEELFFRVFLLESLRRHLPTAWAVALQGAAFGLVHYGSTDVVGLPALAAVGVVLGILFVRGRSIVCCVAAHMAFNSLAVVSLLA